jgi:hypothetical protein
MSSSTPRTRKAHQKIATARKTIEIVQRISDLSSAVDRVVTR